MSNEPSTPRVHRLAAVWFADIADYTRLSAEDEEAALAVVDSLQAAAAIAVGRFAGRVVKFVGDAVLAEFGSTQAALRAALLLQAEFSAICGECGLPARLRIAVHVGDVVTAHDGDILGDGVNRAARLQSLAPPGAVIVSEDVWRQIRPRPEFRFEPLRARRLSGITERVRAYRVTEHDSIGARIPSSRATPLATRYRHWPKIAVVIVAALVFWLTVILRPALQLDPDLVAIAPFHIASSDPQLRDLGEHVVTILAFNLDGAGPLRTVAASMSIRAGKGTADAAAAAALGRRTGAGLVIFGQVIPSGSDSARAQVAILDVGSERVLQEAVVPMYQPAERLAQEGDSLTVAVLSALSRTRRLGDVDVRSLSSLTNWPALKAFLTAEQFYRRTAWDSAMAYYQRALDHDSTFVLPLRRIATALGWRGGVSDSVPNALRLRAGQLNRDLPPRLTLLIRADSLSAAAAITVRESRPAPTYWRHVERLFATLHEAVRRYPTDPEVWYALGDARYHYGFGRAATPEAAVLEAFDSAIALDSSLAPAYIHAIELGFRTGGRDRGMRYARTYLALNPSDLNAAGVRLAAHLATTEHLPEAAADLLDTLSTDALIAARYILEAWPDSGETAIWLQQELARRRTGAPVAANCNQPYDELARQLANRGHFRDARCANSGRPGRLFAEMGLLDAVPHDSVRAIVDRWIRDHEPSLGYALPWLASLGDTLHIRRIGQRADSAIRLERTAPARDLARYVSASAHAYLALAHGDTAQALSRLAALPDTLCRVCSQLDRLSIGRLLAATGRWESADSIFNEWQGPYYYPSNVVAALERGRIAERMGRRDAALQAYRFVANAWARADPVVQPVVADARAAIKRLQTRQSATAPSKR